MSKGRVLIVEDEIDIVRALDLRLCFYGYEVVTANNGVEALAVAITTHPDLVILDIGLPDGDGYTVAQSLLENRDTRSIPIIFLTARTSDEDRERAFMAGIARFLTKPCKAEDLLDTVDRAITCVRPRRLDRMGPLVHSCAIKSRF
jgi:DNA-binding response OmpR family regulator